MVLVGWFFWRLRFSRLCCVVVYVGWGPWCSQCKFVPYIFRSDSIEGKHRKNLRFLRPLDWIGTQNIIIQTERKNN